MSSVSYSNNENELLATHKILSIKFCDYLKKEVKFCDNLSYCIIVI